MHGRGSRPPRPHAAPATATSTPPSMTAPASSTARSSTTNKPTPRPRSGPEPSPGSPSRHPLERVITDNGACYRSRAGTPPAPPPAPPSKDPPLPPPDQRQSRAVPPDPARGMGLHPPLDSANPNATPATPVHPLLQSPPIPRRTRLANTHRHPPPSGTTSPPSTASRQTRRACICTQPMSAHPPLCSGREEQGYRCRRRRRSRFASRRRPRHYRVDDGVGLRPGHDNHDSHHEHHDLVGMWRSGLDDAVCARSAPGSTGGDVQRPTPTDHRPPRRSRE